MGRGCFNGVIRSIMMPQWLRGMGFINLGGILVP